MLGGRSVPAEHPGAERLLAGVEADGRAVDNEAGGGEGSAAGAGDEPLADEVELGAEIRLS
jgi:hypothetical protein